MGARYPLTGFQRTIHLASVDGYSDVNVPLLITLRGKLDKERMRDAIWALCARHEALRVRLGSTGSEVW